MTNYVRSSSLEITIINSLNSVNFYETDNYNDQSIIDFLVICLLTNDR